MNKEQVSQEFYTILNQCLDAVLSGQLTTAECLDRYPRYADRLKAELQIALLASRLEAPEMEGAQVEALEIRLRAQMADRLPKNKVIQFGRLPISRLAAAVLITFMLAFGSGAGLVVASADSVPGETLYPVKRLWEGFLLALASLFGQVDDVWLRLAEVRLDEAVELYQRGDLSEDALRDLYEAARNAIRYADSNSTPKTIDYLNQGQQRLREINPPPHLAPLFYDVAQIMLPALDQGGHLQAPSGELPPSLSAPVVAATATTPPTQVVVPSATFTATLTPTLTGTPTLTPTVTNTPTPRIPPTATSTPTLPPSSTPMPTFTPMPTATWTSIPLPVGPSATPVGPAPTSPLPTVLPGAVATSTPLSGSSNWLRETQRSVYMTQTAGPPSTEEPSP